MSLFSRCANQRIMELKGSPTATPGSTTDHPKNKKSVCSVVCIYHKLSRGNGLKLRQGRFKLEMRRHFLSEQSGIGPGAQGQGSVGDIGTRGMVGPADFEGFFPPLMILCSKLLHTMRSSRSQPFFSRLPRYSNNKNCNSPVGLFPSS